MVAVVTAGIVFGLSAGMAPGPLLVLVISQTLRHGFAEGVKTALAPLITDVPIVAAAVLAVFTMRDVDLVLALLSLSGGLYLFYIAYETFTVTPPSTEDAQDVPHSIRKGAITNALNPHPYLFWMTVGAPTMVMASERGTMGPVLFVFFFYCFLVGSKVAVAAVVERSRHILAGRGYSFAMKIAACLLVIFAAMLVKEAAVLSGIVS